MSKNAKKEVMVIAEIGQALGLKYVRLEFHRIDPALGSGFDELFRKAQ
jgi:hypothetical protein